MNADEIRAITKGWTGTLVTWFMDFDNDAHSQRRCAYYDSGVHGLDGLLERGLAALDAKGDEYTLTERGIDLMDGLNRVIRSGRIHMLPLVFRKDFAEGWRLKGVGYDLEAGRIGRDDGMFDGLRETAVKDRSTIIRRKVATFLAGHGLLDLDTANRLARDKDKDIRIIASTHADISNFYDETDEAVIDSIIRKGLADRGCFEHWAASDNERVRLKAAEIADETTIDKMLATLPDDTVVTFLYCHPQWATGERVERLWDGLDESRREALSHVMRDVPDLLIRDALGMGDDSVMRGRLDEYRKALRTVADMERLFRPDSGIRRKMRARAGVDA